MSAPANVLTSSMAIEAMRICTKRTSFTSPRERYFYSREIYGHYIPFLTNPFLDLRILRAL
jgi:hypothetical protein